MSGGIRKVEIRKVVGPTASGAAVLLGNEEKTFAIFIGYYEAAALVRELRGESSPRPLTHDLLHSVLLGFDISIRQIVISDIIDNAYCATLILERRSGDSEPEASVDRSEVRIDARPSDCLVLAVKNGADIHVTDEVLARVQDLSDISEASFGDLLQSEQDLREALEQLGGGHSSDLDPRLRPGEREDPEGESGPAPDEPEEKDDR